MRMLNLIISTLYRYLFKSRCATNKKARQLILISVMCSVAAITSSSALLAEEKTLTLSKITNNPSKHSKKMQPLADYLASELRDYGYTDVKLVFARNPEQLAQYMREGKVDIASDTPFAYAKIQQQTAIEPLAIRWKNGIREYHSIIFVRTDSGIRSLEDLAGKTIAFEDRDSTSGYALPAAALRIKNLQLERLYSPRDKASNDNVTGYIFSGSEQTTAAWVLKGLVDAGAVSSIEWYRARDFLAAGAHELLAIFLSPPIPRSIEFSRADLDPAIKQRIKDILYSMHTSSRGQEAMAKYQKTSLFEPLDKASRNALEDMQRLVEKRDSRH